LDRPPVRPDARSSGVQPGPHTDERAERFARWALIDDDEFCVLDANGLDDRLIAGHFGVPWSRLTTRGEISAAEVLGCHRALMPRASQRSSMCVLGEVE